MTLLSVNKTRLFKGRIALFFCGHECAHFLGVFMKTNVKNMVRGALLAALYVALCHLQNFIVPGSASFVIQFRVAEALCVIALFTPSAIWGLPVGCLVFALTSGAPPMDIIFGPIASLLAAAAMYGLRDVTMKGYPLPAMLMPAIFNALIIGWALSYTMGFGFLINAAYIAIGEAAVLLILGSLLFYALRARNLDRRLFS